MTVERLPSRKLIDVLIQEGYLAPERRNSLAAINAAKDAMRRHSEDFLQSFDLRDWRLDQ